MKIYSLTGTVGYSNRVKEKQDGDSSSNHSQNHRQQSSHQDQKHSENENQTPKEVKTEDVLRAVEAFKVDSQTQATGLKASVTGHGPGLKVVLKNDEGGIVRQLSGEEFLRLREVSSGESKLRGKILDQKL